jgi:hypothetical protein
MIRAFIVKSREHIESVPRLIDYLDGNPILAEMCGFPGKLPHSSQFYRFLAKMKHSLIENLFYSSNKKLIEQKIVTLDIFIMDSKRTIRRIPIAISKIRKRNQKGIPRLPSAILPNPLITQKLSFGAFATM